MAGPRFAIYFVPAASSELYKFGASVIGYDCYERRETKFPSDFPLTDAGWGPLTGAPRQYGFHATIKAPFFLVPDVDNGDLEREFRAYVASIQTVPTFRPKLDFLQDFIAIIPREPATELNQLASDCVKAFDRFRAPLTQDERRRRLQASLNLRQIGHLEKWGYPYVFEDFRFHLTLTGPIGASDRKAAFEYLSTLFRTAHGERPVSVDQLALVRQDWPETRFYVVCQAKLGRS